MRSTASLGRREVTEVVQFFLQVVLHVQLLLRRNHVYSRFDLSEALNVHHVVLMRLKPNFITLTLSLSEVKRLALT